MIQIFISSIQLYSFYFCRWESFHIFFKINGLGNHTTPLSTRWILLYSIIFHKLQFLKDHWNSVLSFPVSTKTNLTLHLPTHSSTLSRLRDPSTDMTSNQTWLLTHHDTLIRSFVCNTKRPSVKQNIKQQVSSNLADKPSLANGPPSK